MRGVDRAFAVSPAYLEHGEGNLGLNGAEYPWFCTYGVLLSRGFRVLMAWMSIKEHGLRKYSRLIQQNIDQTSYLSRLVESAPELELLALVLLNVVCFRFVASGLDDHALDALNKQVEVQLQEQVSL